VAETQGCHAQRTLTRPRQKVLLPIGGKRRDWEAIATGMGVYLIG
jgi:hypothetical protein